MRNRFLKILLITITFMCVFVYAVFGAKIDGYTTITGTFDNIENGFSTQSVVQALILKNELLSEGKISAEFSNNVQTAQYPVGIVFAGRGIRDYGNLSGSNIYYLRAYFSGNNIILDRNADGIVSDIKSASVDTSVFENDKVRLSVSFSSDGEVRIFVNGNEVINTVLNIKLLYGGELGICAGGDGHTYEITNVVVTSVSHTEHTAGEIVPEARANCISSGKMEYSVCTVCGELIYQKDGAWTVAAEDELIIPKEKNNHIDSEKSLNWIYDENAHKKVCRCGEVLISENHDIERDALSGTCTVCGYNRVHVCDDFTRIYATPGNCVTKGKREHYRCNDCSKLYIRSGNSYIEKSEEELEGELVPENHIDFADTLAWTYDDSRHYKICRCGEVLSSGKHDISASALQGKCSTCAYERVHTCTYTEIPEVSANCMTKGKIAHYKCEACGKLYVKNGESYTRIYTADLDTPKDKANHVDSLNTLEWTRDERGHKKVCRCGEVLVFGEHDIDESALEGVCSVCGYVKTHICTHTKVPEVSADCMNKGKKAHYRCNDCGKLYIKNNGIYTEITEKELEIPKDASNHVDSVRNLEWTYDDRSHTKICRCGAVLDTNRHTFSETALSGTCATCGYVRTHTCTYIEVPELPADCMTKGKIAHYKCEACGKLYVKSGEGYTRIYTDDLDTPKDSSNHADSVNAIEWTRGESGHKKTCRCGKVLAFEEHDIEENSLEGTCSVCGYVKTHTCTYTKISEVPANCITKGQKLHYKCKDCGKRYIKNGGVYTEVTESELEIPLNPDEHIDSVRNLEWTYDDRAHTKTCRCGTILASNKHSFSETSLSGTCATCGYVRTHTCTYIEVPEVPADCITKGKIAHYKCEGCGKLYVKNDEGYTRIYTADLDTPKDKSNHVDSAENLDWSIDKKSHKKTCRCGTVLISEAHDIEPDALSGTCSICSYDKTHICEYSYVSSRLADCISDGIKEHYKCLACDKIYLVFGDKYIETSIEEITVKASHTLEKIDAVIGNCTTEACDEYYKCQICEKLFWDENAENEIGTIPKGEKDFENHVDSDRDGRCDLCLHGDGNNQNSENSEDTEDKHVYYLLIAAVVILFIICAILLVIIKRLMKNRLI